MIVVPFIYSAKMCPLIESVWEVDQLKIIDMVYIFLFDENRRSSYILMRNHNNVVMGEWSDKWDV
jgi:hypothetical protein